MGQKETVTKTEQNQSLKDVWHIGLKIDMMFSKHLKALLLKQFGVEVKEEEKKYEKKEKKEEKPKKEEN